LPDASGLGGIGNVPGHYNVLLKKGVSTKPRRMVMMLEGRSVDNSLRTFAYPATRGRIQQVSLNLFTGVLDIWIWLQEINSANWQSALRCLSYYFFAKQSS
jgi:hypothetical protein